MIEFIYIILLDQSSQAELDWRIHLFFMRSILCFSSAPEGTYYSFDGYF